MAIWARFHSVSATAAFSPLFCATSSASSSRSVAPAMSPNRCTKRIARRFTAAHSREGFPLLSRCGEHLLVGRPRLLPLAGELVRPPQVRVQVLHLRRERRPVPSACFPQAFPCRLVVL